MSTPACVASTIVKAVQDRYTAFAFAGKPVILYADEVPTRTASGAVTLPFIVVTTRGEGRVEPMSELDRVETVRLVVRAYAASKTDAAAIAKGVMYDTMNPADRDGLDDAAALTLPSGWSLNKVERATPGAVTQERDKFTGAEFVYKAELSYDVEVCINGT